MRKVTRLYLLDVLMFLLALLLAVSSTLLWVVFPRGYYGARAFWVAVHKWGGLALGLAVVLHLLLHRQWLVQRTRHHAGDVWRLMTRDRRRSPNC